MPTNEHKTIFHKITNSVNSQQGWVFLLNGYGKIEKTFMWKTLVSYLRSNKDIVLTIAPSGISSLLLPVGRMTHSKFKIHVPTLDNSTCNINGDDDHIVWGTYG